MRRFLSIQITLAQISSSIANHLSMISWMWSCLNVLGVARHKVGSRQGVAVWRRQSRKEVVSLAATAAAPTTTACLSTVVTVLELDKANKLFNGCFCCVRPAEVLTICSIVIVQVCRESGLPDWATCSVQTPASDQSGLRLFSYHKLCFAYSREILLKCNWLGSFWLR